MAWLVVLIVTMPIVVLALWARGTIQARDVKGFAIWWAILAAFWVWPFIT